jgi:hypothetical protein
MIYAQIKSVRRHWTGQNAELSRDLRKVTYHYKGEDERVISNEANAISIETQDDDSQQHLRCVDKDCPSWDGQHI